LQYIQIYCRYALCGRQREEAEKGDDVNKKKEKSVYHSKSDSICLMRIEINHVKTARKRGRRIKVCIIIISNVRVRALGANVNDVIVLSQPPRPH
jgi:hypothetical protein